jgi:hypothetical protein
MMYIYLKYGPFLCIGTVIAILFVIWVFFGGKKYDFVGLAPLAPETCNLYTGSLFDWGNKEITENTKEITENTKEITKEIDKENTKNKDISINVNINNNKLIIDNTPNIPNNFNKNDNNKDIQETINKTDLNVCIVEETTNKTNFINVENDKMIKSDLDTDKQANGLKRGRFISKGERICCETMENIYGLPFKSIRPKWLQNPETGYNVELDCYNDELKLAIEYNGEQHYKWPNYTNQTYEQFINQTRRDTLKRQLCDKKGVYLIVVPYNVPHEKIPQYIISYLPESLQKRLQKENKII